MLKLKMFCGDKLTIADLRYLILHGHHGSSHRYKAHVQIHYKDHAYMERFEFNKRERFTK